MSQLFRTGCILRCMNENLKNAHKRICNEARNCIHYVDARTLAPDEKLEAEDGETIFAIQWDEKVLAREAVRILMDMNISIEDFLQYIRVLPATPENPLEVITAVNATFVSGAVDDAYNSRNSPPNHQRTEYIQ